jgi:hypothetical protein
MDMNKRTQHFIPVFALVILVLAVGLLAGTSTAAPNAPDVELGNLLAISTRDSNEYGAAIAYNWKHNEYLVVWQNAWGGGYSDVYAQRVNGDGKLLSSFDVGTGTHSEMNPAVAYDPVNDRYLVVWSYDYWGNGSDWDIQGRLIPWNGPSTTFTDFPICGETSQQRTPAVAYGRVQEEFMVAWTDAPAAGPTYIGARRVATNGSYPIGGVITVTVGTDNRDYPDVAYNFSRNEYLFTWDVQRPGTTFDIFGARFTATGVPLTGGSPPVMGEFIISAYYSVEERPAVASCQGSDQYLVAWESDQETLGADYAIYARYVNGDAVPGNIYMISDTTLPQRHVALDCAYSGQRYLLAWQDRYATGSNGIWARLASLNAVFGPEFEVVGPRSNADREWPAVAGGLATFLMAWEHDRDGGTNLDIYGRLWGHFVYLPLTMR